MVGAERLRESEIRETIAVPVSGLVCAPRGAEMAAEPRWRLAAPSPKRPSLTNRVMHAAVSDKALCHFRPQYGWIEPEGEPEKCINCERILAEKD